MCFKITFEYSFRGGVFSNIRLSMVMQLICLIFQTFDQSNEGSQHAVSEETKPTHCTLSFLETTKDIGRDWQFKLTKHASKAWRKPFETLLLRWKTLDCWVPLNLPSNKNLCPKAKMVTPDTYLKFLLFNTTEKQLRSFDPFNTFSRWLLIWREGKFSSQSGGW